MIHRKNSCFANANLSLCGCGFLCIYHAGVCAALREYAPQLTRNRIYGASAGSIAAAGLICNVSVADATTAILQVVAEARSGILQAFSPTFDLISIVRDELNQVLPENAHQLCTGRLFISLTRYEDGKNTIISEYQTKKELIQAILCSCFIPIFCGYAIPEFRGVKYIDGGFSDNQPIFDRNTITISPFSGESDICPMDHTSASLLGFVYYNTSIRFNNENFYRFCSCFVPPSQEICSQICRQGFTDALRFLTKNSITPCHRCLSTQSNDSLNMPELKQSRGYYSIASGPGNPAQNETIRKRKRLDSECEVCLSRLEQRLSTEMTTALFPEVLHKTLQEPLSASNFTSQLLNYAHSFRIVQFWLRLFDPVIRYSEFGIFVLKLLNDWLRKTPKRDFFLSRLQQFVDLVLSEVEDRNLLCSSPNLPSQFRVSGRQPRDIQSNYPIGDFESFDTLRDNSLQLDLMLVDFYTTKTQFVQKRGNNKGLTTQRQPMDRLTEDIDVNAITGNALESIPIICGTANGLSIGKDASENDSGISSGFSSNTPVAMSAVSSDDGTSRVKNRKRDVALSPVRALISMGSAIPRPKFASRRHTVGVNSGNLCVPASGGNSTSSVATFRRSSTQSLNKSVHHSLGGSKHSLMSGSGSSSMQKSRLQQHKNQQYQSAAHFHSSDSSGGEQEEADEQFFVPNRMASTVGSTGNGCSTSRQQKQVSDGEYDGDADPST